MAGESADAEPQMQRADCEVIHGFVYHTGVGGKSGVGAPIPHLVKGQLYFQIRSHSKVLRFGTSACEFWEATIQHVTITNDLQNRIFGLERKNHLLSITRCQAGYQGLT